MYDSFCVTVKYTELTVMDTHPFGSAEPSRGGDRRVAAQGLATTGLGPGVQNIERCMSKI